VLVRIDGQAAADFLTQSSFISLEQPGLCVGQGKRTLIAGLAAIVIRERNDAWLIGVDRPQGHYFADWLGRGGGHRDRQQA
jgi:heterotetrameric sarcosine oxidase gamma subunit